MHGMTRPKALIDEGATEALQLVGVHYVQGHPTQARITARGVALLNPAAAQMAAVAVACGNDVGFSRIHLDALLAPPLHQCADAMHILTLRRRRPPTGNHLACVDSIATAIANQPHPEVARALLLAAAAHLYLLENAVSRGQRISPFAEPRTVHNDPDWQLRIAAIGRLNPLITPR